MYHTEGYLDKQTYFHKGHIWSGAMVQQGHTCYVWCVAEESEACNGMGQMSEEGECYGMGQRDTGRETFANTQTEVRLMHWMQQELACALKRGTIAVQKELNRFGACLGMHLYLYYRGELLDESGKVSYFEPEGIDVGVFLSSEVCKLETVKETVERYSKGINSGADPEYLANHLKASLLRAMSEGMLKQGYYFLWEDKHVI